MSELLKMTKIPELSDWNQTGESNSAKPPAEAPPKVCATRRRTHSFSHLDRLSGERLSRVIYRPENGVDVEKSSDSVAPNSDLFCNESL